MSFLRPGVLAFWHRYKRALIPAAGAVLLASAAWSRLRREDWVALAAIGVASLLVGGLMLIELRQARLARPVPGPGIVTITERRILYMGPRGGGTVAVDDIVKIEILTTDDGPAGEDVFWYLTAQNGQTLAIPSAATGAQGFFDAFSALSGIDWDRVIAAMGCSEPASFRVWPNSG